MHKPPALEFKNFGGALLEAATGRALPVKTGSGQAMEYKTVATADAVIETHTENDGEEGIVEAYVAVTGTRDEVGDVIEYGAFDRTLKALRPKMCLGHDWNRPIGEPVEIRVLMPGDPDLPAETADGDPWPAEAGALYTKNRYMLTTKDGRDAYEHAKFFKGRTAYSIGYVVKRKRIGLHNGLKTRFIQDLDLYEYGPVLHGAHSLARQRSIKSGEPGGIEHKVRKVKDASYWGYPVGTPITAAMRPKGPTARKLRKEGKVPDRNQGTSDSVTAAGKPAPKRTTPDKATADADAGGLFPEPKSEARVRARNPKGEHEQHTEDLGYVLADDELTSASMQASFEGLLDEGITPQELDEDLRNLPRPADVEEADWSERIDDAVAAYRTSYKRENRRQQTVDKGNAGGEGRLPRNPKAKPENQVGDILLQTESGRPESRDKLIGEAYQKLVDDGVHPDEVDIELEKQRPRRGESEEDHRAKMDAISAEYRRRYDAALAERGNGKGEPGDDGTEANTPEGGADAPAGDAGQPGPPPLPEGDDDGSAPEPGAEGDGAPAPRKFDRTEVPGASEGAAYPNPEHVTNTPPPKVRKGSKLHTATSPQTGEKFYRSSPRPYTHATLVTDEKTGAQSAWSFSESQNGALNQAKEFRRRGIRGRIHVVELDADHDGTPDSPELDPNAPGNADAITRSEGLPDVPGDGAEVPAEPDPTTRAMWRADPARARDKLPEAARAEYDALSPDQQKRYAEFRAGDDPHDAALKRAQGRPESGDPNVPSSLPTAGEDTSTPEQWRDGLGSSELPPEQRQEYLGLDAAGQDAYNQARAQGADHEGGMAAGQNPASEEDQALAQGAPDAGAAEQLPEPPAELTPEEQAWADDPAAAADGQLDEEQRAEYDALDDQGKRSYATARVSGENHDDALEYAQHRSAATAPAAEDDANAPAAGDAAEQPPAPGELRPTGAEATPANLANTIATYGAKVDLSQYDTDMLTATDAEFARRAELLGKPGEVTKSHQLVKDEIARRGQGGDTGAAPGTPSELPASPNLGVAPGADGATGTAPDLGEGAQDASGLAIPGGDVTPGAEGVQTPAGPQGDSQAQEATRELAPERTAQITADDIAEANATADASFGVEEADDGVFEVDQDVADRQDRVGALLDAEAAGSLDLASQTDDGLRGTRADVVNELKLQDHLTARERNAAAPTRGERSGTAASGGDGSGDPNAEPAVDPGPKVRPGVAGALEDFADALDGDDPDEILRARARLLSSLKRSRTDSEVITAVRAVIESTEYPDPALLRAAAERLRAETRERRNSQARARRAARRFERDRLRSLLGSIDAEMRRRNLSYDPVPGLDDDADTTAPAAGGPTAGTWTARRGFLGSRVESVSGANYDGTVEQSGSRNLHRYQWTVHNEDGEVLASGSGLLDDPEVARTAVAQALAAQQTLGRIPADAVLPQPGGDNSAARREVQRSGVDAITARIDDSSVNPVTGLPSPLAPPAGLRTPPVKAFDTPQAVRAHLDATTVHPITNTPNAAGPVLWDTVTLSPGGGLAVGSMQDGSATLFHAASGRSIRPFSGTGVVSMNKTDLMKMASYLESMSDANGKRIDWGNPDHKQVAQETLNWKSPADGSNLLQAATRAVIMDKVREGKWNDPLLRNVHLKPVAGDGTNPSRRSLIDDLKRSHSELIKVQGRSRLTPEDKKTQAMISGAGLLADAGAPDGAAVLLRRRAAELREMADKAEAAARNSDTPRAHADADALRRSAQHADVLDNLADAYLSLHSPASSPGTRLATAQPGERLAFREGDGVRTYRVITPMRFEGDASRVDATASAQVIDETTGQQLTVAIQHSANARPLVRVYDPDDKYGRYVGSRHATSLGGDGFVVLDTDQPAPEAEGFRDAALADAAAIPSAALDRAAEDLPETPAERGARRAAAPEGGRAPARRSAAAPRREAPAPTRAPATSDEQKLAQAQVDGMAEFVGAPLELNEAAAPGGFKDLDEVVKAADERAAQLPADTPRVMRSSLEAIGSSGYNAEGGGTNPNHASGGAKLSPGGHLIVRSDGDIVHAKTGLIIWTPNGPWSPDGNVEKPSPAQVMRIADHMERSNVGGVSIPWESADTTQIRDAYRTITERTGTDPLTAITHAAMADHMAGVSRPTANDVSNLDTVTSGIDTTVRLPNPDIYDAQMSRGVTENSYIALTGKRVPANNSLTGETAGAGELPDSADSKEGQTLAKRVFMEFALSRAQAKVAPLDSARRLDAIANELDGRTITSRDGKTFTPSDDLRARSKAIRDAYDDANPSPLGQLARANFDGTLAVDWGKAEIGVGQVSAIGGYRSAEQGTRNVRLAKLKTELREGGTVQIGKSEAGNLKATMGGRTIEDGVDGGTVKIGPNGAIVVSWQEDLYGGAGQPGFRLPSGTWKLDQQASTGPGSLTDAEYEEHTSQIEAKLAEAFSDGQATDVVHTIGHDGQSWTPERAKLHNEIINEMWQANGAHVPTEGRAVLAGGLGGAGKSTVLKGYAGIDATQYFTINSDDVKEAMAARDMIPKVEGLSPMESVALVHEESGYIANLLAARAYANNTNVVWDMTMGNRETAEQRVKELRDAGYTDIGGVFVDIPVETSVERALARHRRGMEKQAAGEGYGGRYVPPSVIRANTSETASSRNRENFDALRDGFDSWVMYDNSVAGREPQKVAGAGAWA